MTDIIVSLLISKEFPYNLVVSDKGQAIYIIPRKFEDRQIGVNSTWLDLSGIPTIFSEDLYKKTQKEGAKVIEDIFLNEVALEEDKFIEINKEIIEKFKKQFVVK